MYEEKKKFLDEAIDKLHKEADAMNGIFGGAVVAAIVMFLLLAVPDIASQWSKGLPEKITKIEDEIRLLDSNYRSVYKIEPVCLTEDEKQATLRFSDQQKVAVKICNKDMQLRSFKTKLDWYTTFSEMRLTQEKGELLIKLVPALILAAFAGSLLNYRHLKTKEVELIKKRVELLADGVPPTTFVTADKPKV
jgi:hypothetical protein